MYHQAKPTETFRERQLVLLQEAEDRCLLSPGRGRGRARQWLRKAMTSWERTSVPLFKGEREEREIIPPRAADHGRRNRR